MRWKICRSDRAPATGKIDLVNEDIKQPNLGEDAGPAGDEVAQLAALAAERDRLAAERDLLVAEKAELEDRLLRRQADFENYRRRVERDRSDYIQFAAMELVRELLPILDDFERAAKVETADKEYAKGIDLIYARFFETLKRMGLEPIETAGRTFDPNIHQALDKVETSDAEDHAILHEYQKGYNFKGKLLRPSLVKVAVRP